MPSSVVTKSTTECSTGANKYEAAQDATQSVYRYDCSLCDKQMSNLPRHLRDFHNFTQQASRTYTRQRKKHNAKKTNNIRASVIIDSEHDIEEHQCPVTGCHCVVKRIDKHLLSGKHMFKPSDQLYRHYIKLSKRRYKAPMSSGRRYHDACEHYHDAGNTRTASSTINGTSLASENIDDHFVNEITSFGQWLQSFGGGDKTTSQASQMVKHVEKIISIYGQDFRAELVSEKLQAIEVNLITCFLKTKTASTVKNYLLDFKKFVEYGKLLHKDWITSETAARIVQQIQLWNRSLQKKILKRCAQKKLEHRQAVVTADDIRLYLKSSRAITGNKVLRDHIGDKNTDADNQDIRSINRVHYIRARNHLIMLLCVNNATRSGPIVNLKISEAQAATQNVHDGRHVINVIDHKTVSLYGAAQLSLKAYHFNLLTVYIEKIRPLIPNFDKRKHDALTSNVFISWNGRTLNQSEISNIVSTEITAATKKTSRTSCTVMRKSVVTIIVGMKMGVSTNINLAKLMKHSPAMQTNTYDVGCSDSNMAKMSNLVWKVMTKQQVCRQDLCE